MIKKILAIYILILSVTLPTFAQTGSGAFTLKKKTGYSLIVSFVISNGKVRKVSFDLWEPIGKSSHNCGLDGRRGDGKTTWTDEGAKTTVEYTEYGDESPLFITKQANGKLHIEACGTAVLFTPQGAKYVGAISQAIE